MKGFERKMVKDEQLHKRVKFLYYEQDMTEKEIAEILGRSRQWISNILNSDENHKELLKKKKQKRTIKRNAEFYKKNIAKISIPISFLDAIGINEEERELTIKVVRNKIVMEKVGEEKV